jgi:hypothetical protein
MAGILYVVYNESIRDPETNERYYKIGITKNSVSERFAPVKMPGKFEALFAYKLDDYEKAEQLIHGILNKYRENGEWFNLTQKELDLIKANCEVMGGKLVTDEFEKEINIESEKNFEGKNETFDENQNITNVVDKIMLANILERDILRINDNICFKTTVDVLNGLFGKKYKQGFANFGKCYFKINKGKHIWLPFLDQRHNDWINTMPDEKKIQQKYCGNQKNRLKNPLEKIDKAIFTRKPNDNYRFVGIFHNDIIDGNIQNYKRVSEEFRISEWLKK